MVPGTFVMMIGSSLKYRRFHGVVNVLSGQDPSARAAVAPVGADIRFSTASVETTEARCVSIAPCGPAV